MKRERLSTWAVSTGIRCGVAKSSRAIISSAQRPSLPPPAMAATTKEESTTSVTFARCLET